VKFTELILSRQLRVETAKFGLHTFGEKAKNQKAKSRELKMVRSCVGIIRRKIKEETENS